MKVFSRQDMPDDVKAALKEAREYHNDGNGCIRWHMEFDPPDQDPDLNVYPDESNLVCKWLLENGALDNEYVIIDISW